MVYRIQAGVTALVLGGQRSDTLRTYIHRYTDKAFILIDQRATASAFEDEEIEHVRIADACDFIQPDDGEIRARCRAFDPGDALNAGWQLRIDLYEVTVSLGNPVTFTGFPGSPQVSGATGDDSSSRPCRMQSTPTAEHGRAEDGSAVAPATGKPDLMALSVTF
jgi:hypothetical protein